MAQSAARPQCPPIFYSGVRQDGTTLREWNNLKLPGFLCRIGAQVSAISAVRTSGESADSPPRPGEAPFSELDDMLRETEHLCQMIFNNSNDAILVSYAPEGRFVDVNPKACTMLGYTREELLATPLSAIQTEVR